jgi:membrane-associated phospholipid phosphatase
MTYVPEALFLTDFADQAVMVPMVLVIAVALWLSGWRRGAVAWCSVVPLTLLAVGLAKFIIFRFGAPLWLPDLLSPSGHTASAALVYGGLMAILLPYMGPWRRVLLVAAPLAAMIGLTRLSLHVHTPDDVIVGAVIGLVGAISLARLAGNRPVHVSFWPAAGMVVMVVTLFHGIRLPAEVWLHAAARDWPGWWL